MDRHKMTEAQSRSVDDLISDIWRWTGAIVEPTEVIIGAESDGSVRAVWLSAGHLAVGHFNPEGVGTSGWGRVEMIHFSGFDPCECDECRSAPSPA